MNKYLPIVLILILAACSAPPLQATSTSLPPTFTFVPSETSQPTATLPPTETSTPKISLPQDLPQEFADKLEEWQYTVEGDTVSVDGEAWFQKNETGEWEKGYYEMDAGNSLEPNCRLRYTPSDLFGGRIKINPEKAGEICEGLVEFYETTNKVAGTSNSIVEPRLAAYGETIAVGLKKVMTPIETDVVTLEIPDEINGPRIFISSDDGGEYAPLTYFPFGNPQETNQHAGVRVTVDDNHLVFSFISHSVVESKGNIVLTKKSDSTANSQSAIQIFNYLSVSNLIDNIRNKGGNLIVGEGNDAVLYMYVADILDFYGFVENDVIAHTIIANPTLLLDDVFVANNIKDQSIVSVEQLHDVLVVNPFLPR